MFEMRLDLLFLIAELRKIFVEIVLFMPPQQDVLPLLNLGLEGDLRRFDRSQNAHPGFEVGGFGIYGLLERA
ncbi:MAG: hypothetical protein KAX47_04230 [Zoogloea sp.]|nr:hypothetical protein [Zoogloea sp.]